LEGKKGLTKSRGKKGGPFPWSSQNKAKKEGHPLLLQEKERSEVRTTGGGKRSRGKARRTVDTPAEMQGEIFKEEKKGNSFCSRQDIAETYRPRGRKQTEGNGPGGKKSRFSKTCRACKKRKKGGREREKTPPLHTPKIHFGKEKRNTLTEKYLRRREDGNRECLMEGNPSRKASSPRKETIPVPGEKGERGKGGQARKREGTSGGNLNSG